MPLLPARRRRPSLLLAVALAGAVLLPSAGAATAEPAERAWSGTASDVFRTGTYSSGEWIYTNTLFQALGADADGLKRRDYYSAVLAPSPVDPTLASRDLYNALTYDFFGAHRAAHNGDHQLPRNPERWPDGTGEITEVRLAVDGDDLYLRFRWNSMPRPDAQIATLTFAGPAARDDPLDWPGGARLRSGYDTALTVWGTGGTLTRAGGQDTPLAELGGAVSAGDHVSEARIPLSALPAGPWTLSGGSGLHDEAALGRYLEVTPGQATESAPGSGGPTSPTNMWGLLFVAEDPATLDELEQSRALTAGVLASGGATVDPTELRAGRDDATAMPTGSFSRVLDSRLFQADGIRKSDDAQLTAPTAVPIPISNPGLNVSFFYTGRQQRYDMHVPERYPASTQAWPLIVYLHGFTGLPEEPFRNPVGLVETADEQGYLLASALGRGDYFYRGEGELDVLEVVADVSRRYRVDADRIYVMGHSMGGFGSNNLATHHPDLFAAAASAQGTDSIPLAGNLSHVPWFEMTSEEDLDTLAQDAKQMYGALSQRGYDATLLDYSLKIHEYSSIYDSLPRLFAFFGAHRRVTDPGVVTWVRPTGEDRPELGLIYDGAYWVDGVRATDADARAEVTVESFVIPHAAADPVRATRTDARVDEGGPTGRTAAQLLQTVPAAGAAVSPGNRLRLDAANTAALTVDAARARLAVSREQPLTILGATDGPVTLSLLGLAPGAYAVTVDGTPAGTTAADVAVAVTVPAGEHTVVLSVPRRAAEARSDAVRAGRGLASTGGGLPWAVGLLVAAAAGAAALRRRTSAGASTADAGGC